MDELRRLFDYQRFARNSRLQKQIDSVYRRYLSQGEALSDEELDLAAAGEPWMKDKNGPPGTERTAW